MIQKILELDPKNKDALQLLKEIDKRRWEDLQGDFGKLHGYKRMLKQDHWLGETFGEDVIPITSKARKYFNIAEGFFIKGAIKKAEFYYKIALTKHPRFVSCYQRLGEINLIQNNYKFAEYGFTQAIKYNRAFPVNYIYLANVLLLQRRYDEAIEVLNRGLKFVPNSELSLIIRALLSRAIYESYIERLKQEQGIDTENLLSFTIKDEATLTKLIREQFYYLKSAININGDWWFPHYLLAYVNIRSMRKDIAISNLNKAIRLAPGSYKSLLMDLMAKMKQKEIMPYQYDSLEFHLAKADMLYKKGLYEKARGELLIALGIAPGSYEAHLKMGLCYSKEGKLNRSITQFRQALSLKPDAWEGYIYLGKDYLKTHQYDDAIDTIKNAIALNPKAIGAWITLGEAYLKIEDYLSALEAFKNALSIDNKIPKIHLNMGNIYTEQEIFDKAIESFENALRLNPEYIDALVNIGIVYFKLWDRDGDDKYLERAIEYTEKAYNLDPNNDIIKDYLDFYRSKLDM